MIPTLSKSAPDLTTLNVIAALTNSPNSYISKYSSATNPLEAQARQNTSLNLSSLNLDSPGISSSNATVAKKSPTFEQLKNMCEALLRHEVNASYLLGHLPLPHTSYIHSKILCTCEELNKKRAESLILNEFSQKTEMDYIALDLYKSIYENYLKEKNAMDLSPRRPDISSDRVQDTIRAFTEEITTIDKAIEAAQAGPVTEQNEKLISDLLKQKTELQNMRGSVSFLMHLVEADLAMEK